MTPPVEGSGPNALEAAVLRIRDKRGEPVGAGLLVSDGLALTCAHVVSVALGIAEDVEPAASARIRLDLPLLAAGTEVTAGVERWEAPSDVAVLRLSASPPGARPIRLVEAQDMWEHPVRAFGFPAGRPGGVWHSGVLRARQADGWLQADLAGDGYRVSRGFSGTPVWDERLVGVVGMVTVVESGEPAVSYLIPTGDLLAACPELRDLALPPPPSSSATATATATKRDTGPPIASGPPAHPRGSGIPPDSHAAAPASPVGPLSVLLTPSGIIGITFVLLFVLLIVLVPKSDTQSNPPSTAASPRTAAPSATPSLSPAATLTGNDDSDVTDVAFSPDGKILAAAGDFEDPAVRLWDVAKRRNIATLHDHKRQRDVMSVAFSPDGKTLASGSADERVRLWDVAKRRLVATLRGHTAGVNRVVFSPDGKTLASGSDDGTVRLWDVADHEQVATLDHTTADNRLPIEDQHGYVTDVAFSPDGKTLASTGGDNTVRLWNVTKRRQVATLREHTDTVINVAFSPDGRTIATNSEDNTLRLWDATTHQRLAALRGEDEHNYACAMVFSPDGRTLAYTSYDDGGTLNTLHLLNVANRQRAVTITQRVGGVAFSPDGRTLATSGYGYDAVDVNLWKLG